MMPKHQLPENWILAAVGDLNSYVSDNMQPAKYPNEIFELYSIPIFPTGKPEVLAAGDIGSSKQFVLPKDVLLCKINPRINRVWIVGRCGENAQIASSEWVVVRQPLASENYLAWCFRSKRFRDLLCADVSGVGGSLTRAQPKKIATFPIPLPPAAEQKVIADKLDTLLAQVEITKARLERIPALLKTFRQSVLAAAVSGRLTAEWREDSSDDESISGLPAAWSMQPALSVCLKVQSGSTPRNNPFDQGGRIPFLKVYNIVDQQIDFDYRPQFVTSDIHEKKLSRSIAFPGDVLMNIVGPPLGKVAVLSDQYPEWNINQAITLFRANPECLIPMYLYHVLREGDLVRKVMPDTKGSVGQVNISLTQCRKASIPVPPLPEQTQIVHQVETLFAHADKIEQQAKAALERVNNLSQSILAKAFRGELTADWRAANPDLISGDNSAEALLAKIQAEREALKKQAKPKRARVKKK